MKVYIRSLGCKVNSFDGDVLCGQFERQGHQLVDNIDKADVVVLNSCSVTAVAEKEARYLLRRYKRDNPEIFSVITGCYAQIQSGALAGFAEVDFVVPNEVKSDLVELLEKKRAAGNDDKLPLGVEPVYDNRQGHFKSTLELLDQPVSRDRVRKYLKIQDGCNGFCSYCQIPLARGASRSVSQGQVIEAVRGFVAAGVQEVVLTGIHLGDYGADRGDSKGLCDLLHLIFAIPGLRRLRLSSLEPSELSYELLRVLYANKEIFCPHFHLPLQSGSDGILVHMRRSYLSKDYAEKVGMIREFFPDAHLSADLIPGFPGETEADFMRTVDFVKELNIASLHVFPYSERPRTSALKLPNKVAPETIKRRGKVLRELSKELLHNYNCNFLSTSQAVLWESRADGRWYGKSKNYIGVCSKKDVELAKGSVSKVILRGFLKDGLMLGV